MMKRGRPAPASEPSGFDHPAFADVPGQADGVSLEQAHLTDRQRLAVVLQGAAVLAHLEHTGWFLPGGFSAARLCDNGALRLDPPQRGRAVELPQILLVRLLAGLFGDSRRAAGPGAARRAARQLQERWRQILVPTSCERAVVETFEAAPFLWQPEHAHARASLAASYPGGGPRLAAPHAVARRFFAQAPDLEALRELLASDRARDLWEDFDPEADPVDLAARGRRRRAVAHWRRRPPGEPRASLAHARALAGLGRFAQAKATLDKDRSFAARLLRLHCLRQLGELQAARNALRQLAKEERSREQTLALAEEAVRLLGSLGEREESRDWVARAMRAAGRKAGPRRSRATLLAAEAAWDAGEYEAMRSRLEDAAAVRDGEDPALAARWHQVRALHAIGVRDGEGVVAHTTAALAMRRAMGRAEAGRRFSDLAYGRVLVGDLAGAERACQHAVRLLGGCEGPSRDTLALYNLAEVRLRRGRLAGVREALEISTAENRRSKNRRAALSDLELWVRLALVTGRPEEALNRIAEAQRELDSEDDLTRFDGRGDVFELLAARAHGWLLEPAAAAACLSRVRRAVFHELEPEERPALHALAGDLEAAAEAADATPWAELWSALASGLPPSPVAFGPLERLEPYRTARLVYDLEIASPGIVPVTWLRRATASLRAVGAESQAMRLEGRSQSPWRAVERFLEASPDDANAIAVLFREAGFADVRLSFEERGREEVLLGGRGGPASHALAVADGRLILRSDVVDPVLRTLTALVGRHLPRRRPTSPRSGPRGGEDVGNASGILGESAALRRAVFRLDRLATGSMPVLVLGESGTGKELFARRLHDASVRAGGPFLPLNCAALSENLIQSELFGHARGAFTGADRERAGIFETARGGTVFLDEIGDLPLIAQGKLLRVLQENEIRRLGESFARKIDVRIVAATHRDLAQMVAQEEFREDLFYRLKVGTVELPPLRERDRDVLLLARHFLGRLHEDGRAGTGETPPALLPEAEARILSYAWPGNIRELRNILETAAALVEGSEIGLEELGLPEVESRQLGDYHQMIERYRGQLISEALAASGGNKAEAARRLGLSRQGLSQAVRNLKLDV